MRTLHCGDWANKRMTERHKQITTLLPLNSVDLVGMYRDYNTFYAHLQMQGPSSSYQSSAFFKVSRSSKSHNLSVEEQREETQRYIKELDKNIQIGIWENDDE